MVDNDTNSWKSKIIYQIRKRNEREINSFSDLISYNNKLLDNTAIVSDENLQLKIENEKLRKGLVGVGGGSDPERVQALEQKILLQQEELTKLHKRRGEHTQLIVDLNASVQERDKTISEKDAKLSTLTSEVNTLKVEVGLYQANIRELDVLNQTIRDEHTALQLAFASLEEKLMQAQKENAGLLDRLMSYKTKDAERLNEENEGAVRQRQAAVQRQLEEAARDNTRVVSPDRTPLVILTALPSSPSARVSAHDGEVNAVRWSPVDRMFATGGADRKVKLWEVTKGGVCESKGTLVGSNAAVMSVEFNSTGTLMLAASNDFASRVWTVADQRIRHTLTGHGGKVLAAKFLSEGNKVVSGSHDRTLKLWDLKTGGCVETKFAGSSCNDLVTADSIGSTIISGHFDKKIRFWDSRAESSANLITLNGKVTSLDLSRDGKYVISCVRDDTLKLLDLRMNQIVRSFSADGFKVGCDWSRATFAPDGQHIAVGSNDGIVFIWSVTTAKVEATLREHTCAVTAVHWLPFSTAIASVDRGKQAVVWGDV